MSFFARLFGKSKDPSRKKSDARLAARIEKLEAEAREAAPAYVGSSYNRVGDVALRAGDLDRALSSYGRAIDAFLNDGQREAARGVANKIIRVRPAAVRTLCTLTWLDLSARHMATALLHLRDYVQAAKEADESHRAARQIHAMARLVTDSEFLAAAADALDSLAFTGRATEVREWAQSGGSPEALTDVEALSAACLHGAVHSNESGAARS